MTTPSQYYYLPRPTPAGCGRLGSPSNVEVVVKVLNGCGLNNRYWVFMAGLTNVRVYVTVVDINGGGNSITYISPVNTDFAPVYDTEAFPCS